MNKKFIIANWKCNPEDLDKARRIFDLVENSISEIKNVEVVICPPFVHLSVFQSGNANIKFGAQNCFWKERGAYTGEISPTMLKNLNCEYVILGHSERRTIFSETDEMINKKIKAAIKAGLKIIFCVGETEEEKKKGKTLEVLQGQIKNGLKFFDDEFLNSNIIIAYEPVWAIGTGDCCQIKDAKEINIFLKNFVKNFPIIYGGSVNSQNAFSYMKETGFDGLLIGGASLVPDEFVKIIMACQVK
jgi:triosephosphate isomerase